VLSYFVATHVDDTPPACDADNRYWWRVTRCFCLLASAAAVSQLATFTAPRTATRKTTVFVNNNANYSHFYYVW